MRSLGSDNHSGFHPKLLKAMIKVNKDHDPSYGTDSLSKELDKKINEIIGPQWKSFHCFNGTAANVMALKSLVQSHHSILCSSVSHLNVDECGAPEFQIGAKLIPVSHKDGKILIEDAQKKLIRFGDQHFSQVKALSITQPTELGTCYSLKELKEISKFCKENQISLHIDGARLPNALFHLKTSFKALLKFADAVSFGGTKNGLLGSELVLIKKDHAQDFKFIRKQSMQLPSKTRFLSAQFLEFLKDDLYLEIAQHSCEAAQLLASSLEKTCGLKANYPVQSNAVFVNLPKAAAKKLKKLMFFYIWDSHTFEARLMTSFDTTKKEIYEFVNATQKVLAETKGAR